MNLEELDYDLPERLIAQVPLADRTASRMLCMSRATGELTDRTFRDFPAFLTPGDVLILNRTRVTAVRLYGHRPTGGKCEVLLLRPRSPLTFEAMVRPAKKLTPGTRLTFPFGDAVITGTGDEGLREISFASEDDVRTAFEQGIAPLPPYIAEPLHEKERYQTVYSTPEVAFDGSAAAPTAGLHFDDETLREISSMGVHIGYVTLNVGLDTFRPIQAETLEEHVMHGEECEIEPAVAELINSRPKRCWAVGTTTVRTIESFANPQGIVESGRRQTRLFLHPGNRPQVVDGMLTNFHMPRTTMLLMLASFASTEAIRRAYAHAVSQEYRFLSFGDCMLLHP